MILQYFGTDPAMQRKQALSASARIRKKHAREIVKSFPFAFFLNV